MESSGTLKFESNVPVEVALKYEGGREVTSSVNGEKQMMYTLTNGQRMYLDLNVAARVDELGVKTGIVICKVGKGATAQWAVQRSEGARGQGSGAGEPKIYPPKPVETSDQVLSRKLLASDANVMRNALKAAVSAASEAQLYAKSIGFEVVFTPSDITQLAVIAARMQGGVR
jgi:hypothetical protein